MGKAQEELRKQHAAIRELHFALTASRRHYYALFDAAVVAYITLSPGGLILELNQAAVKLVGGKHALLTRTPFAALVLPADLPAYKEHLRRCLGAARRVTSEFRLVDVGGHEIPVQFITAPHSDGAPVEYRTMAVDLRQLRTAQEALQRSHDELENRVRQRTTELREANIQLSAEVARRERLETEVIAVSEREQRRFGQDLHDETCQTLGGLSLTAGLLARQLDGKEPELAELARELCKGLGAAIDQARGIARGLHPVTLEGGLGPALQLLLKRVGTKLQCHLECDMEVQMPEDIALTLYRIAQEALTNVLKHARARHVSVRIWREGARVSLAVEDDGIGLKKLPPSHAGMGLDIIGFRARLLGGSCVVQRKRDGGTQVACYIPVSQGQILPLSKKE